MIAAKVLENRTKKPVFLLKLISKGNERALHLYREVLHFYENGKDKGAFFVEKRLPLHLKSYLNKGLTLTQEQLEKVRGDIRNRKLIKKPEDISEFFKTISEVKKGDGEIVDEIYTPEATTDYFPQPEPKPIVVEKEKLPEIEPEIIEPVTPVETEMTVLPTPKKKRAPRKTATDKPKRTRKLKVTEVIEY